MSNRGKRGRPAYTRDLNQNLFEPFDLVKAENIEGGDGGEINGNPERPAKIQALQSSSALGEIGRAHV